MTLDPQLEDRLRAALRRPENASWPEEDGAFDQFLRAATPAAAGPWPPGARWPWSSLWPWPPASPGCCPAARSFRRPRRSRAGRSRCPEAVRGARAGRLDRLSRSRTVFTPGSGSGSGVALRPMRRAANTMVMVYTAVLSPVQYPGREPGGGDPDPSVSADRATERLEDRGGPLGRGRRPDGRPYVWQQTLLGTNEVAKYAIAWPYHGTPEQACPPAARWRVLVVNGVTEEGPRPGSASSRWFGASSTRSGRSPTPCPAGRWARSTWPSRRWRAAGSSGPAGGPGRLAGFCPPGLLGRVRAGVPGTHDQARGRSACRGHRAGLPGQGPAGRPQDCLSWLRP